VNCRRTAAHHPSTVLLLLRLLQYFSVRVLPANIARSLSDGPAIWYAVPVSWMTLYFLYYYYYYYCYYYYYYYYHHYTRLTASFPGQSGQAGTRKVKTSLDLNEARDYGVWGCSGISWIIRKQSAPSLQTDNHINIPLLNFYRPDAFPDAQPTVSEHYRH